MNLLQPLPKHLIQHPAQHSLGKRARSWPWAEWALGVRSGVSKPGLRALAACLLGLAGSGAAGAAADAAWAQGGSPASQIAPKLAQAKLAKPSSARQGDASRRVKAPADAQHPLYWLERWHGAVVQHPYVGTVTAVQAQGRPRSARVWHGVRGGQQIDRIDMLPEGRPHRTLVRSGQHVAVWDVGPEGHPGADPGPNAGRPQHRKGPRHHVAHDMPQVGAPFSPAGHMDAAQLRQAAQYYRVVPLGQQQVARYVADAIGFLPVDDLRAPYRFWTEPQTGLLLKWQMLELSGRDAQAWSQARVLREMAFEDVQVPAPVDFAMLHSLLHASPVGPGQGGGPRGQPFKQGQQPRTSPPRSPTSSLHAQGWAWRRPLPGYVVTPCHWRDLAGSQRGAGGGPRAASVASAALVVGPDARLHQPVLHCLVTDGLSRFSLFIGPQVPVPPQTERGAHGPAWGGGVRMARRVYGNTYLITAVGAVPQTALQQAVDALYRP